MSISAAGTTNGPAQGGLSGLAIGAIFLIIAALVGVGIYVFLKAGNATEEEEKEGADAEEGDTDEIIDNDYGTMNHDTKESQAE